MRIVLGCALVVVMACGATAADEKIDAKKLVGKWEPKEKKEKGNFVVEFQKDGKIVGFIPDPVDKASDTSAGEGVAVDAAGNIYGAEVGPKALNKYVKK